MVTLTEEATKKVTELLAQETEDMALRVAVRPVSYTHLTLPTNREV